jgi:hypothetical protein
VSNPDVGPGDRVRFWIKCDDGTVRESVGVVRMASFYPDGRRTIEIEEGIVRNTLDPRAGDRWERAA